MGRGAWGRDGEYSCIANVPSDCNESDMWNIDFSMITVTLLGNFVLDILESSSVS